MTRKAIISDVARAAGVSPATVDRVIHGREGVSQTSAARVTSAIESLGYGKLPVHLQPNFARSYRFVFLLPDNPTEFVQDLEVTLAKAVEDQNNRKVEVKVLHVDLLDENDIAAKLDRVRECRVDGVAMFALDSVIVKTAIDRLAEAGKPVCTMVSDIPNSRRFGFIGQDNIVAGRTAARIMGLQTRQSGKVIIVTGSNVIRDQSSRIFGFREVLSDKFPNLQISEVFEGQSMAERNRKFLAGQFASSTEIVGVYCAGAGASGVIAALREHASDHHPTTIVHELTPTTRDALADGTIDAVIHHDREQIIGKAIDAMCRKADGRDWPSHLLTTQVFFAENLP